MIGTAPLWRWLAASWAVCIVFASTAAAAGGAGEGERVEPAGDGGHVRSVKESLPDWLLLDAEYRVETVYLNPVALNGTLTDSMSYTQQRLRLDAGLQVPDLVRIVTQFDLLNGVLFGDNGDYPGGIDANEGLSGQPPEPENGLSLTSRWPNNATWGIGLVHPADPLNPDSYGPVLRSVQPVRVNRVYGEVMLPFGLLRVGRQPAAFGPGMSLHDGSRSNRWGVSKYSVTADRFLFATKVSEAFRMIGAGPDFEPDRSMDHGVFLAVAYDQVVNDDVYRSSDDLHQALAAVQWKARSARWFGLDVRNFLFQVAFGGRFGSEFDTRVFQVPVTLDFGVGPVHVLGEFAATFGHTREVSEGFAALREPDPAKRHIYDQKIRAYGARFLADVTLGPVMATLEFDYASGDADPRDETPLTTFSFARDTNVGLLLFEHVLAFETARSAAVGIRNLKNLGAGSFPLTELASDGRFQNAIALFPQVLYRPHPTLGVRAGALVAWSAAPVVDPVMTLLAEDGRRIDDDAVNWNGGRPARYYGTELDLQIEWAFREHFLWTLEGAVLFPGAALRDRSGDAVTAFLVENRFTFLF